MDPRTDSPGSMPESLLAMALHACRKSFYYAMGFSLAINLLSLLIPIYSMQVFDRVFTSRSIDTLIGLTSVILVGLIFYGAFNAIRGAIISHVVDWFDRALAPTLFQLAIRQASVSGTAPAAQYQRELLAIKNFLSGSLVTMMDIPWSLIFLLVITLISPFLGFIALVGITLLVLAGLFNEYATKRIYNRAQEHTVESMDAADAAARNAEAIEAMGMMERVTLGWMQRNEEQAYYTKLGNQRSTIIQSITRVLRTVLQVAITAFGAVLVLNNQLTAGGMIASSMLIYRAMGPFESAIMIWKQFTLARDAYRKLNRTLHSFDNKRGDTALPPPRGAITVENLYYQPSKTQAILKGVALRLEAGEALGIIGPSAAGKSTLAKCIIGIYPPTFGQVRLDGADVYTWSRTDFGQYVGYLPQDVELFYGTIKQNIARMQPLPDDAEVIRAAQMAGVHEMILRLPKGYDTEIKPGHGALSPGQRQRVGLARAMFGSPKLVVLDEPNSNLDGEGDAALLHCLRELKTQGVTTVIVAHRPTVLQTVDKILVLAQGAPEAIGPRDDILARYMGGRPRQANPAANLEQQQGS
jgi:ATP-binding cassette subfamily B protein